MMSRNGRKIDGTNLCAVTYERSFSRLVPAEVFALPWVKNKAGVYRWTSFRFAWQVRPMLQDWRARHRLFGNVGGRCGVVSERAEVKGCNLGVSCCMGSGVGGESSGGLTEASFAVVKSQIQCFVTVKNGRFVFHHIKWKQ